MVLVRGRTRLHRIEHLLDILFSSSHDHQDLIVACITLGIGLLAIWRGFQPPPQEPPDLEKIG